MSFVSVFSDSEYTYEEVEVEIFETDESDDEDRREPDTILEPQITETDDQIPDCVLESDHTSRFSQTGLCNKQDSLNTVVLPKNRHRLV